MAEQGEGSRGGKIVGHYRSGRAKYDSSSKELKVAALTAGGIGVAAGGGHMAGVALSKGADVENRVYDLIKLAKRGKNVARKAKMVRFVARNKLIQKVLENSHSGLRIGAAVGGAALFAAAASEAVKDTDYDTIPNKAMAFTASGIAATALTRIFENRHVTTTSTAIMGAIQNYKRIIRRP